MADRQTRLRLAVLADVHGNLPALEAVLEDAWREGQPDGIIVAGDHVVGAPYPAETLKLLGSLGCTMIAGNRDGYVLRMHRGLAPVEWQTGESAGTIRWTLGQLGPSELDLLYSLPDERVVALDYGSGLRVVHGAPGHTIGRLYPHRDAAALGRLGAAGLLPEDTVPALDAQLAGVVESVLVCGHTHVQWAQIWDGGVALNPGSVGQTLDADPRARYALLVLGRDGWQVDQRAVSYDVASVRRVFRESGLLQEGGGFARACLRNVETGRNFPGHFVRYAETLAQRAGLPGDAVIPDEVWQQAAATFDWENGAP